MNPYGVSTVDSNIRAPLVSLNVLYDRMPQTTGCEKCGEINGDNLAWCCRTMNPSMYYVEFLYVWEKVQKWTKKDKAALIVRAVVNYLSRSLTKGCIFYDGRCLCYDQRPLACRMYGVVPQDVWDRRLQGLKDQLGEDNVRHWTKQCDLVSVKNGSPINEDDEMKWFNFTKTAEERIGVPSHVIKLHDLPAGSYRTFHDHLLLELFPAKAMNGLTATKMRKPNEEWIRDFARDIVKQLETSGVV